VDALKYSVGKQMLSVAGDRAPLPSAHELMPHFVNAAAVERVPLDLLLALSWVESQHEPSRVNGDRAGLMGMTLIRAKGLGCARMQPVSALFASARFLARAKDRLGSWELAIAAHYWGIGRVKECPNGMLWPSELQRFVLAVWRAAGWPLPSGNVTTLQPFTVRQ